MKTVIGDVVFEDLVKFGRYAAPVSSFSKQAKALCIKMSKVDPPV
jgi:hypothetical protein